MLELDDGTCISETIAICRFFAEHQNDTSLFGTTPDEKGLVEMWQRIVELDGLHMGFQAFRNLSGVYGDRERCVEAWGNEAKLRVEEFLPKLDKQLAKNQYIAGERFSIVDITGFLFVGFVCEKALEIKALDSYPNIQTWFSKVSERPAFQ